MILFDDSSFIHVYIIPHVQEHAREAASVYTFRFMMGEMTAQSDKPTENEFNSSINLSFSERYSIFHFTVLGLRSTTLLFVTVHCHSSHLPFHPQSAAVVNKKATGRQTNLTSFLRSW